MRRWGIIITAFYAAVVLIFSLPGFVFLVGKLPTMQQFLDAYFTLRTLDIYVENWGIWIYTGILVAGEAILLFLSVDTSWRHAKPRQHIAVTALLAGFFAALLAFSAIGSLAVGIFGGTSLEWYFWHRNELVIWVQTLALIVGLWAAWGVLFMLYGRGTPEPVAAIVSWLLKGSVLELLIAVPAHVIVRQRGDCTAPAVTGFGIVTGLSIMLLCFGPGVLALYKKRLDAYKRPPNGS